MLIFTLKKEWYEKIRRGEKTVEYRELKPYWTSRIRHELIRHEFSRQFVPQFDRDGKAACLFDCAIRLGYTKQCLKAEIVKIVIVDGKYTDLAIDAPVYAIHLADVREGKV